MMSKLNYEIKKKYSKDYGEIMYILNNLKNGRIYGFNGNCSRSDGTMETNAEKLEKLINDLIYKIENEIDDLAELSNFFIPTKS